MILFFLGLFILFALAGKIVVDAARDDLEMKILLVNGAGKNEADEVIQKLKNKPFIKKIRYVSQSEALKELNLGKEFLEANKNKAPFFSSVNIRLTKEYFSPDSLKKIETELESYKNVQDIDFPIRLIELINNRGWAFWQVAIILGIILSFGAYLLILNTVRLDIYSKRLTIRSMQLIGATRNYIRKPFVNLGVIQGAIGGLNATLMIVLLLMFVSFSVIDLDVIFKSKELYILFIFLIIFGSTLGYVSSHRAVDRYLDKHLDEII